MPDKEDKGIWKSAFLCGLRIAQVVMLSRMQPAIVLSELQAPKPYKTKPACGAQSQSAHVPNERGFGGVQEI